jgi:cellulose synthase operon protein C
MESVMNSNQRYAILIVILVLIVSSFQQGGEFACGQSSKPKEMLTRNANETHLQFVERLRRAGAASQAMSFLKELESNDKLKPEITAQIPLELALTHVEIARIQQSFREQWKQKSLALKAAKRFLVKQPQHTRAADAYRLRGRTLLFMSRAHIYSAQIKDKSAPNPKNWETSRQLLTRAKVEFISARDRYLKKYSAFPVFIPVAEKAKRLARRQAETRYIYTELDLASISYWIARTYPQGSAEKKTRLAKAASDYSAIHKKYRTLGAGLYARNWQAKCLQEQGEINKAMEIHEELQSHQPLSKTMISIRTQSLHFMLICMNDPKRKDFLLSAYKADSWLKAHKEQHKTEQGLGIRWQLVIAQEAVSRGKVSRGKTLDDPKERLKYLKAALKNARFVKRHSRQHEKLASAMILQIETAMKSK